MKIHEKYMHRCIQLAQNGLGTTYPNPLVGSVVVHNDTIIGEGWHYQAGQPHAEVHAINSVEDKSLLTEATIYVSLEPCSHFGKTPPCASLIIEMGIKNVIIGSTDPNPKVAGKGIVKLTEADCKVTVGVLENECDALNKRFFTFQKQKRPYIFLKWAQTQNGFIAPETRDKTAPVWITSELSRQLVHKLRAEEEAILIGTNTALEDNPSLTTRDWQGKNPIRIVIDRSLKIPESAKVYNDEATTIFIAEIDKENTKTNFFEVVNFSKNVPQQICDIVYRYEISSLIVEGGSKTLQHFIDACLWDEAFIFTGNTTFANGTKAPVLKGTEINDTTVATDTLKHFKNQIT